MPSSQDATQSRMSFIDVRMSVRVELLFGLIGLRSHETRATPNDPKLSEPRGWRDRCVVGARRRPEAAGVTAARVRCSAWLGVAGFTALRFWLALGQMQGLRQWKKQMASIRETP